MKVLGRKILILLLSAATTVAQFPGEVRLPCEGTIPPDPWEFGQTPINVTMNPFLEILEGSLQYGGVANGLSGFAVVFTYNAVLQQFGFDLTLPSFQTIGHRYSANGYVDVTPFRHDTFPSGPFQGNGTYQVVIKDLHIKGHANFLINLSTDKINVRSVEVSTLTFSSVFVELGSFTVDSSEGPGVVDWDYWNVMFATNFNSDWHTPSIKQGILTKYASMWNSYLDQFTLREVYDWWTTVCTNSSAVFGRN
jgi:hypothetical protein